MRIYARNNGICACEGVEMDLSPKQIVNELNKYIIGQEEAKKAVAIALRNRYRRSKLSPELMDEITPKT